MQTSFLYNGHMRVPVISQDQMLVPGKIRANDQFWYSTYANCHKKPFQDQKKQFFYRFCKINLNYVYTIFAPYLRNSALEITTATIWTEMLSFGLIQAHNMIPDKKKFINATWPLFLCTMFIYTLSFPHTQAHVHAGTHARTHTTIHSNISYYIFNELKSIRQLSAHGLKQKKEETPK